MNTIVNSTCPWWAHNIPCASRFPSSCRLFLLSLYSFRLSTRVCTFTPAMQHNQPPSLRALWANTVHKSTQICSRFAVCVCVSIIKTDKAAHRQQNNERPTKKKLQLNVRIFTMHDYKRHELWDWLETVASKTFFFIACVCVCLCACVFEIKQQQPKAHSTSTWSDEPLSRATRSHPNM